MRAGPGIVAVMALALAGCGAATPEAAAPSASGAPNAILRPIFAVDGHYLVAGTAFLIRLPGGPVLLVTAHHLFGPAGGYQDDLRWDELPRRVSAVYATSVEDRAVLVVAARPLAIEGAITSDGHPAAGDVAAFVVADPRRARILPVATAALRPGDRVFLLAQVLSGPALRHAATVEEVGPLEVTYRFDAALEIRATSGAPLVDADNRVVAIHLGGGSRTGPTIGYGNPATAFVPRLQRALAAR